jgi:hypothetical protein
MPPDDIDVENVDSLRIDPSIHFDLQQETEEVLLLIREHPITQVPWVLNSIGLVIILIIVNLLIPPMFSIQQILFFNIFAGSAIFAYAWLNFLRWYFEVGIITNERILDIDFKSILYKEVSITNISNIEEIASRSGGYLGALFNYGNIYIKTAGANEDIEFHNAPNPTIIIKLINKLTDVTSTTAD